jgi:hypothetical protein
MVVLLNFLTCPYFNLLTCYTTILVLVSATVSPDTTLSAKKGRLNRMPPMCQANIANMLATDRNVCHFGGVANRHKSRHCQPKQQTAITYSRNWLLVSRAILAEISFPPILWPLTIPQSLVNPTIFLPNSVQYVFSFESQVVSH